MEAKFTFPKKHRLKDRAVIEMLFAQGNSVTHYPLKLLFLPYPFKDEAPAKFGVVVPKRNLKKAVQRNKVKRQLKECLRLQKPFIFNNIEHSHAFFILYLDKKVPVYHDLEQKMIRLFQKFLSQNP